VLLFVPELEASCANQLLRLDTLPIDISFSGGGQIESRYNIDDRVTSSRDRGNKTLRAAREQLLPILTGGKRAPFQCLTNFKCGRAMPYAARACRGPPNCYHL
jgi:hypothetical protein